MKILTKDKRFEVFVETNGNVIFADNNNEFSYCANCGNFVKPHELKEHSERCETKNIFSVKDRECVEKKTGVKISPIDLNDFRLSHPDFFVYYDVHTGKCYGPFGEEQESWQQSGNKYQFESYAEAIQFMKNRQD